MRLIDADALKEALQYLKLINYDNSGFSKINNNAIQKCIEEIDNAPSVELTKPQSYAMGFCDGLKAQTYKKPPVFERPQGEIRWTDKLSITSSGDIIDFEGRVVGHVDLEIMKGGAE